MMTSSRHKFRVEEISTDHRQGRKSSSRIMLQASKTSDDVIYWWRHKSSDDVINIRSFIYGTKGGNCWEWTFWNHSGLDGLVRLTMVRLNVSGKNFWFLRDDFYRRDSTISLDTIFLILSSSLIKSKAFRLKVDQGTIILRNDYVTLKPLRNVPVINTGQLLFFTCMIESWVSEFSSFLNHGRRFIIS